MCLESKGCDLAASMHLNIQIRREMIRILSMVPISFIENANAQTISKDSEFIDSELVMIR